MYIKKKEEFGCPKALDGCTSVPYVTTSTNSMSAALLESESEIFIPLIRKPEDSPEFTDSLCPQRMNQSRHLKASSRLRFKNDTPALLKWAIASSSRLISVFPSHVLLPSFLFEWDRSTPADGNGSEGNLNGIQRKQINSGYWRGGDWRWLSRLRGRMFQGGSPIHHCWTDW